jgi:hypothetical protein
LRIAAQGYLRKLYGSGDVMLQLSARFTQKEREAVAENTKAFKKSVKAIDKPAAAKDWEAFVTGHDEITAQLNRFPPPPRI